MSDLHVFKSDISMFSAQVMSILELARQAFVKLGVAQKLHLGLSNNVPHRISFNPAGSP